ncbi:unnamed protein product [Cylicocyclus nassatus]|uniref:Uncharacterized protein n=1 Tax=Cylicocyclus nassatus TaxID=53992 RepID=A0AA36DMX8_CYLNA|nr:unnamed protein product [Cylicocyclus nassatus]
MMFMRGLFLISLSNVYCKRVVTPIYDEFPWLLELVKEVTNRTHKYTPQLVDEAVMYLRSHPNLEHEIKAEILLTAKYDEPYNPAEALEEAVSLWKSNAQNWTVMNATTDVGCARRDNEQTHMLSKHPQLLEVQESHDDDQGLLACYFSF